MDKKLFEKKRFLWRLFTFSGYISRGAFWSEIVMRTIGYFCATIVLCIILSVTVPGETEDVIALVDILVPVLGLVWLIPVVALTRRRLRDAGFCARSYLWLLVPGVGAIIFIARLCAKSVPRKPDEIWFEYN